MMNIFVVRILHTSCCRLIQPVKMYAIWYMMWYLEKDMFCKEHIFSNDLSFLKRSVHHPFFGRSGRRPSSSGHVPRGIRSCICMCFVRTWNFTIACAIAFSDRVHDRMNDLFQSVQGLNPWPCRWSIFMGPGFESLPVQHDLFVGPGFDSLARIARF